MKILAIADTHISEQHSLGGGNVRGDDGLKRSLVESRAALDWVLEVAQRETPDLVVHCGDVFDRAAPTPGEYAIAADFFRKITAISKTFVVVGNHDRGYSSKVGINGLTPISNLSEHVELIDYPTVDIFRGVQLLFLPYPDRGRFAVSGDCFDKNAAMSQGLDVILQDYANEASLYEGPSVLFSHVTFAGAAYDSGQPVAHHDAKAPTARLSAFDAVLAGHLHKRQTLGGLDSANYIGPPWRWSFNDEGNPAGVALFDTDHGEYRFVENESAPRFRTFEVGAVLEDPSILTRVRGTFARIVGPVDSPKTFDEVQAIAESARDSLRSIRVDVVVTRDEREMQAPESATDELALFDHYVNSRPDAIPETVVEDVRQYVANFLAEA